MRFSIIALVLEILLSVAGLSFKAAVAQVNHSTQRLERELGRLTVISEGTVGVAAIHLESGQSVFVNGDVAFPMASTYKIPIAVQLLSRVDRGELSLTEMVDLRPEDLHPGSGTLTRLFDDPGVSLSVHNLMELMLLISDNSATDLTLRLAGGPAAVNARMAELGVAGLRVDRPTSVLIGDYVGVDVPANGEISPESFSQLRQRTSAEQREAAAQAFATDPQDTSTPRAMAGLLVKIWHGEALSEASTALLIDVLERVETGENRLRGLLPPRITVAHKTGTIGATTNDVGIIYLPEDAGHVVTVVFVKDSSADGERRERAIAQIARAVYDYFLFRDP
jgi:beta-lactamase class A